RAALSVLGGLEAAYVADVQDNPPSCRPCGGTGELPVDDLTPPVSCGECGGTGREQVATPTAEPRSASRAGPVGSQQPHHQNRTVEPPTTMVGGFLLGGLMESELLQHVSLFGMPEGSA